LKTYIPLVDLDSEAKGKDSIMQYKVFRKLEGAIVVFLMSMLIATPFIMIDANQEQRHGMNPTATISANMKSNQVPTFKSVLKLNSRNFDTEVRKSKIMLVEFYAPWCSHCKQFESTYNDIYRTLQRDYPQLKITVAKVDGSYERALSSRFNIRGYPSFYLIDGWSVWAYQGSRKKEDMVKFAVSEYTDLEPIPFLNSPFGPLGLLKIWLMYFGIKLMDMHEYLVEKGLPSMLAAGIMALFGFFSFVICIVVIGIMAVTKMKTD